MCSGPYPERSNDRRGLDAVITRQQLNALPAQDFIAALASIFEHSAWVPERVAAARPFTSVIGLHGTMCDAVMQADEALQLALIRAHPELAGRAAIRGDLTAASTSEQKGAGLAACTPLEYERLRSLNAAYNGRFGFPFVLAVKGHTPQSVIATLEQRVTHEADEERTVALREICRIAYFRLTDLVEE
jgi:OHCU decarboxylase